MARGSAAEVQSHLHVALGLNYIEKSKFDELYLMLTEVSRMTLALARYLRGQKALDPVSGTPVLCKLCNFTR